MRLSAATCSASSSLVRAYFLFEDFFRPLPKNRSVYGNIAEKIGSVGRRFLYFFLLRAIFFYLHTSSITNIDLLYTKLTALNSSVRFLTVFCNIDFDLAKIGKNMINPFPNFFLEGRSDILIFFSKWEKSCRVGG